MTQILFPTIDLPKPEKLIKSVVCICCMKSMTYKQFKKHWKKKGVDL